MPLERLRSTGRCDSGTVAVETAIVSLFLVVLLFGIVESAFLFKDWLTVSAAARAGARMGASEPNQWIDSGPAALAQDSANQVTNAFSGLSPANRLEVWVYKTSGPGNPPNGLPASCTTNCMKYTWPTGATALTFSSGTWVAIPYNFCAGDANRYSLGVYVKYQHTSPLGFFFNNATVSESTVMWIEPTTKPICFKP
jgi:hypothetical protein